ncbi:MAG: right-handed parallel beta-helix repeat-containing protein [Sandaracinaceae bacterium]
MRLAWLIVIVGLVGCESEPFTGVDVDIGADACVAADVRRLEVRVLDASGGELGAFDVTDPELPSGVRVRASDSARTYRVVARAWGEGDTLIGAVELTGGFTEGQLTSHRGTFERACYAVSCPEGRTCREGRCMRDTATAYELPDASLDCPTLAWVDASRGDDGSDCTDRNAPCATIRRALVAHTASGADGPIILVRGGTPYRRTGAENAAVSIWAGGSADRPVTLRAWPGGPRPVVDAEDAVENALDVNEGNVIVDGFEVVHGTDHGVSLNGSTVVDVALLRCDIHDNGSAAMPDFDNRAGVIVNNGASRLVIAESAIHDNRNSMASESVSGIHTNDGNGTIRDVVLDECVVFANQGAGLLLRGAEATLVGNRVYQNVGSNVVADGVDALDAHDNVVCDAGSRGIHLIDTPSAMLANNTIVGSNDAGIMVTSSARAVIRATMLVDNGGPGIRADAALDDGFNLYSGNATEVDGFMRAQPTTDVLADPMLTAGVDPCTFTLGAGSPARGASMSGGDIGAPLSE